jgi:hypothetical protein
MMQVEIKMPVCGLFVSSCKWGDNRFAASSMIMHQQRDQVFASLLGLLSFLNKAVVLAKHPNQSLRTVAPNYLAHSLQCLLCIASIIGLGLDPK